MLLCGRKLALCKTLPSPLLDQIDLLQTYLNSFAYFELLQHLYFLSSQFPDRIVDTLRSQSNFLQNATTALDHGGYRHLGPTCRPPGD